jgi:hypothetical protein
MSTKTKEPATLLEVNRPLNSNPFDKRSSSTTRVARQADRQAIPRVPPSPERLRFLARQLHGLGERPIFAFLRELGGAALLVHWAAPYRPQDSAGYDAAIIQTWRLCDRRIITRDEAEAQDVELRRQRHALGGEGREAPP